jgi:hypothetical protein
MDLYLEDVQVQVFYKGRKVEGQVLQLTEQGLQLLTKEKLDGPLTISVRYHDQGTAPYLEGFANWSQQLSSDGTMVVGVTFKVGHRLAA